MNKTLDDFSKNLAGSMSRRKAFWKFLAGAGVVGFLGTRKAKAGLPPPAPTPPCVQVAAEAYACCLARGQKQSYCWDVVMPCAYAECIEAP